MGPASIKMYDKFGLMIRIETTTYDVSFLRHYRQVEHRSGGSEMKCTTMKKTIYSLPALFELTAAATHRYLKFLSTLDDPTSGAKALEKLSAPVREAVGPGSPATASGMPPQGLEGPPEGQSRRPPEDLGS
jgi:hypothetical protein